MGKIASKEKDEHDITASDEFAALIPKSMTQDEKLSIGINGDALSATNAGNNSDGDEKLFKSKREMLILLGLSIAIFSVTCCESILAPFYAPEVSFNFI